MPKYKVTKARTFLVEAENKLQAKELVAQNEAAYFEGEWQSVQEVPQGWLAATKKQLTGK
jgi:hypothetical protein